MKKGILIGFGVIAVAIVAVFVFIFSSLDSLVEQAIEKTGSEATQASVTLDSVNIEIGSGKVALDGFTIGNPKGFQTPSAFKLGGIAVAVDMQNSSEKTIIVKTIAINGPEVTYELTGQGSNVDALKRNVDAFAKRMGAGQGGGEAKPAKAGEGPNLIIETLTIRGGKVNVSAPILQGETMGAALPDIRLKDIGKDKGGASPAEVAKKIIDALNAKVGDAMASIGVGKTLDSLKTKLGASAEAAKKAATEAAEKAAAQATEKLGAQSGATTDAIKEGVGQAGESVKKLFGR